MGNKQTKRQIWFKRRIKMNDRQRSNNCSCYGHKSNLNRNSAVCIGKTLDELKVYGHEQAHHTKRIWK
jgi:hypothetical protein